MSKVQLKVIEHDGSEDLTEVESYNPQETSQMIKEAQSHDTSDYMVLIGDIIVDARSIKKVKVVKDTE
jgi:hypothetical protein